MLSTKGINMGHVLEKKINKEYDYSIQRESSNKFLNNDSANSLLQSSLSGKVHKFHESMPKEQINEKMDKLFGW